LRHRLAVPVVEGTHGTCCARSDTPLDLPGQGQRIP